MSSPLALSTDQVTLMNSVDSLLNQAMLSGVVDPFGNQLTKAIPPLPMYGTLSTLIQEQTQAALRGGYSALISAMGGVSTVISLGPLTMTGTPGSLTFTNGILTAYTNPT
jgi:hypothetical protein